ncbi:hypothetical protein STEG23_036450 [Scotinomys teguina]
MGLAVSTEKKYAWSLNHSQAREESSVKDPSCCLFERNVLLPAEFHPEFEDIPLLVFSAPSKLSALSLIISWHLFLLGEFASSRSRTFSFHLVDLSIGWNLPSSAFYKAGFVDSS